MSIVVYLNGSQQVLEISDRERVALRDMLKEVSGQGKKHGFLSPLLSRKDHPKPSYITSLTTLLAEPEAAFSYDAEGIEGLTAAFTFLKRAVEKTKIKETSEPLLNSVLRTLCQRSAVVEARAADAAATITATTSVSGVTRFSGDMPRTIVDTPVGPVAVKLLAVHKYPKGFSPPHPQASTWDLGAAAASSAPSSALSGSSGAPALPSTHSRNAGE